MAGANSQRQSGVQLNASEAGDDDSPVRRTKHGGDPLRAKFWVVQLNECAGVEEVIRHVQSRSSRCAMIVPDQEPGSLAVILRISS